MLVSVESTDKFDNSTLVVDCSDEEFRSIEAPLYSVLHRTTAYEPLRKAQEIKGQKCFETWHAIERGDTIRGTCPAKKQHTQH